jgi:hypothetical protein
LLAHSVAASTRVTVAPARTVTAATATIALHRLPAHIIRRHEDVIAFIAVSLLVVVDGTLRSPIRRRPSAILVDPLRLFRGIRGIVAEGILDGKRGPAGGA